MGRRRLVAFIIGAATIAIATFACRQLVGIGNDPPQGSPAASTDAGAEGGFTYGQGACAACVATSCDEQATKCANNPSCSALEECMSGCATDPMCRAQCSVDHGLGNDGATPAFEACLASSCADACGATCGSAAALFPPAMATECQGCIVQKVCAAVTSCLVDPDCQASVRCQFSSGTPDAQEACPQPGLDSGGAPSMLPGYDPIAGLCSAECSWGADWSCVGKVEYPVANLGPVAVTANVFDADGTTPIDGAVVKICAAANQACVPPSLLGMGVTADGGIAAMTRNPIPFGEPIYLDISAPGYLPTLVLDYAPLSAQRAAVPVLLPTRMGVEGQAANLGLALDPNLGLVTVVAVDCRFAAAAGVSFSIETPGPPPPLFYFRGGVPVAGESSTDSSGVAVFANVPVTPTTYTIKAMPLALGRTSSTIPFFVRDGGFANFQALPTP